MPAANHYIVGVIVTKKKKKPKVCYLPQGNSETLWSRTSALPNDRRHPNENAEVSPTKSCQRFNIVRCFCFFNNRLFISSEILRYLF